MINAPDGSEHYVVSELVVHGIFLAYQSMHPMHVHTHVIKEWTVNSHFSPTVSERVSRNSVNRMLLMLSGDHECVIMRHQAKWIRSVTVKQLNNWQVVGQARAAWP